MAWCSLLCPRHLTTHSHGATLENINVRVSSLFCIALSDNAGPQNGVQMRIVDIDVVLGGYVVNKTKFLGPPETLGPQNQCPSQ